MIRQMSKGEERDRGAIGLGEKIFSMLDEGGFTATYKFAVLLGLIDLCLESPEDKAGLAPDMVTTRQMAEKVLALYWPHTTGYCVNGRSRILIQNKGRKDTQAEIVSRIMEFRGKYVSDPSCPVWRAKKEAPERFETLVRFVEFKLIEMPLPRLQLFGGREDRFLFEINWTQDIRRKMICRSRVFRAFSSVPKEYLSYPFVHTSRTCKMGVVSFAERISARIRKSITSFPGRGIRTTESTISSLPMRAVIVTREIFLPQPIT